MSAKNPDCDDKANILIFVSVLGVPLLLMWLWEPLQAVVNWFSKLLDGLSAHLPVVTEAFFKVMPVTLAKNFMMLLIALVFLAVWKLLVYVFKLLRGKQTK